MPQIDWNNKKITKTQNEEITDLEYSQKDLKEARIIFVYDILDRLQKADLGEKIMIKGFGVFVKTQAKHYMSKGGFGKLKLGNKPKSYLKLNFKFANSVKKWFNE